MDLARLVKAADLAPGFTLQPHQERVRARAQAAAEDDKPYRVLLNWNVGAGKSLGALSIADAAGTPAAAIGPAAMRPTLRAEAQKFFNRTDIPVHSYNNAVRGKVPQTDTLLIDEAQRLGSAGSAQSAAVGDLAQRAKNVVLMSGTPVRNNPAEFAPLMSILTGQPISQDEFKKRYVGTEALPRSFWDRLRGVPKVTKPALVNTDELAEKLKGHVDYFAPDTPPVDVKHEVHEVPMTPRQAELYRGLYGKIPLLLRWKLKMNYPLTDKEMVSARSFLTGPRQVALSDVQYRSDKDPLRAFHNSGKLTKAYELLRKDLDSDKRKRAIVYSNFLAAGLQPYAAALAKDGVPHAIFHGGLSDAERKGLVNRFNSGDLRVALVAPAGAEGISLKGAQTLQLLDEYWHGSRGRQAAGRGIRFDSHSYLPEELRHITVQKFHSTHPVNRWERLAALAGYDPTKSESRQTVDHYLESMSERKDRLNTQLLDLLKRVGTPEPAPPTEKQAALLVQHFVDAEPELPAIDLSEPTKMAAVDYFTAVPDRAAVLEPQLRALVKDAADLDDLACVLTGAEVEKLAEVGRYVTSYVPRGALDSVRAKGLMSSKALLDDPDALAAAAAGRGEDPVAFAAGARTQLSGWKPDGALGPNVVFRPPPRAVLGRFPDNHPLKKMDLARVLVDLRRLMKEVPGTRVHGQELMPYEEYQKRWTPEELAADRDDPSLRHRDLEPAELAALQRLSARKLWASYGEPDGKGRYAPNVPHAAVITPSGVIDPKYLKFADLISGYPKSASWAVTKGAAGSYRLEGDVQGVGLRKALHAILDRKNLPGLAYNDARRDRVYAHLPIPARTRTEVLDELLSSLKATHGPDLPVAVTPVRRREVFEPVRMGAPEFKQMGERQGWAQFPRAPLDVQMKTLTDRYRLRETEPGVLTGSVPALAAKQLRGEEPVYRYQLTEPPEAGAPYWAQKQSTEDPERKRRAPLWPAALAAGGGLAGIAYQHKVRVPAAVMRLPGETEPVTVRGRIGAGAPASEIEGRGPLLTIGVPSGKGDFPFDSQAYHVEASNPEQLGAALRTALPGGVPADQKLTLMVGGHGHDLDVVARGPNGAPVNTGFLTRPADTAGALAAATGGNPVDCQFGACLVGVGGNTGALARNLPAGSRVVSNPGVAASPARPTGFEPVSWTTVRADRAVPGSSADRVRIDTPTGTTYASAPARDRTVQQVYASDSAVLDRTGKGTLFGTPRVNEALYDAGPYAAAAGALGAALAPGDARDAAVVAGTLGTVPMTLAELTAALGRVRGRADVGTLTAGGLGAEALKVAPYLALSALPSVAAWLRGAADRAAKKRTEPHPDRAARAPEKAADDGGLLAALKARAGGLAGRTLSAAQSLGSAAAQGTAAAGRGAATGARGLVEAGWQGTKAVGRAAGTGLQELAGYGPGGPLEGRKLLDSTTVKPFLPRAEMQAKVLAGDTAENLAKSYSMPSWYHRFPGTNTVSSGFNYLNRTPLFHPAIQVQQTTSNLLTTPLTRPFVKPLAESIQAGTVAGLRHGPANPGALPARALLGIDKGLGYATKGVAYAGAASAAAGSLNNMWVQPHRNAAQVIAQIPGSEGVANPELKRLKDNPLPAIWDGLTDRSDVAQAQRRVIGRIAPYTTGNVALKVQQQAQTDPLHAVPAALRKFTLGGNLQTAAIDYLASDEQAPEEKIVREELGRYLPRVVGNYNANLDSPTGQRMMRLVTPYLREDHKNPEDERFFPSALHANYPRGPSPPQAEYRPGAVLTHPGTRMFMGSPLTDPIKKRKVREVTDALATNKEGSAPRRPMTLADVKQRIAAVRSEREKSGHELSAADRLEADSHFLAQKEAEAAAQKEAIKTNPFREAKRYSDMGTPDGYAVKAQILRDLIRADPGAWRIDSVQPTGTVGVTHASGWRYHMLRDQVLDLPLALPPPRLPLKIPAPAASIS